MGKKVDSNSSSPQDPTIYSSNVYKDAGSILYQTRLWTVDIDLDNPQSPLEETAGKANSCYEEAETPQKFASKEKLLEFEAKRRIELKLDRKKPKESEDARMQRIMKEVSHSAENRPTLLTAKPTLHSTAPGNKTILHDITEKNEDIDPSLLETKHQFESNSPLSHYSYQNEKGEDVVLSSAVTSSSDVSSPSIHMLRRISYTDKTAESEVEKSICYTGRPDTEYKALEQAKAIFLSELHSGSTEKLRPLRAKGSDEIKGYEVKYVVNSFLTSSPIAGDRKMLEAEREVLKSLEGQYFTIEDPKTKEKHLVRLKPILLTRELNFFENLRKVLPSFKKWDLSGDHLINAINKDGLKPLLALAQKASDKIKPPEEGAIFVEKNKKQFLDSAIILLRDQYDTLAPEEVTAIVHMLCEELNLPTVYHCKSSTDRTGIAVALVSALNQAYRAKGERPKSALELIDFIKKESFKELFFSNLVVGHQMTQHARSTEEDQSIGYKFRVGWRQNPLIHRLLPKRFLKPAPAYRFKKAILGVVGAFGVIVHAIFYIPALLLKGVYNLFYLRLYKKDHSSKTYPSPLTGFRFAMNLFNLLPKDLVNEVDKELKTMNLISHD